MKLTQIKPVFFVTALAIAVSCGILKGGNRKNRAKVAGTILVEEPACNPPVNEKAPTKALTNTTFYIKHGKTNHADSIAFDEFSTDENGKFALFLAPGDYAIVQKDKLMDFGEFRLKYSSVSNYFKVRDEDCFRRWYNSADFQLHVSNDTTLQLLVKSRCYIKTNPCVEYTGPR